MTTPSCCSTPTASPPGAWRFGIDSALVLSGLAQKTATGWPEDMTPTYVLESLEGAREMGGRRAEETVARYTRFWKARRENRTACVTQGWQMPALRQ